MDARDRTGINGVTLDLLLWRTILVKTFRFAGIIVAENVWKIVDTHPAADTNFFVDPDLSRHDPSPFSPE